MPPHSDNQTPRPLVSPEPGLLIWQAWEESGFFRATAEAFKTSLRRCLQWLAEKLEEEEMVAAMETAWAMSTARNEVVFNRGKPNRVQMAQCFQKMVKKVVKYRAKVRPPGASGGNSSLTTWELPPKGMVKVNMDAFGLQTPHRAGKILRIRVRQVEARWRVEEAEVAAVRYGLEKGTEAGFDRMVIESDAFGTSLWKKRIRTSRSNLGGYKSISSSVSNGTCQSCQEGGGDTVAHLIVRLSPEKEME
ncbi:hypothetical protein Cgig2_017648 [Carnegiea gigantea]|uniref:Uncharacterized protein n=1 Tax=Carnegiea gigantea TaxID=171969 RepID=A0A9Q1QHB8_9CARY|nr:hypothetical protein Cgig2_017648 [Carnegiea gigantea]